MKHSLSTSKRNKIVTGLRQWNEDLRRSLEKTEVPANDDSRKVQELKRRFSIQRCSSIRQCLDALHRALGAGLCCTCPTPHQAAIDLDWATYESDTAKGFKVAISYGATLQAPQLPHSWRKLQVVSNTHGKIVELGSELLIPSSSPTRALSITSPIRSKIAHFKLTQTPSSPLSQLDSPKSLTPVSISASTEIPTNLCDVVCTEHKPTGLLRDPDEDQNRHFSLEHDQADSSKIIKAVHLKSLLSSDEHSTQPLRPYESLSAKQRYGIAASIAWSVLHLSGSFWLSDYWDEKQAGIFLKKYPDTPEVFSRHPCAIYDFSSTTMEEPSMNSLGRLIPNRTVFALGILLIELCINKPISEIRHADEGDTSALLLDEYQSALSKLDEVYSVAGDSYGYAAERCVKFSFQGRDIYNSFDYQQFRQQFYDAVVAPVQATYLMFPDSQIPVGT